MTRIGIAVALAVALAHAPMQCARNPGPDERLEDQPGDALFSLSEKFRAEGNAASADATLRYLIAKYPSDRHAPLAREMLSGSAVTTTAADGGSR